MSEELNTIKRALVANLRHAFDTCNDGDSRSCFTCDGLAAVARLMGEELPRVARGRPTASEAQGAL